MIFSRLLLLSFTVVLLAQDTTEEQSSDDYPITPPQTCYQFNKKDFHSTFKVHEDIFVNTRIRDAEYLEISFRKASDRENNLSSWLKCPDNKSNEYNCSSYNDNNNDKTQFFLKDDAMYLHVDYIGMSLYYESTFHYIKSKNKTFVKGVKSPCYLSLEPKINVKNVKKGSKKEKLLKSINIKDVIIYDLDYYEDFVLAVGIDNSPSIRESQSIDQVYQSLIIRSKDRGKTWQRIAGKGYAFNHNVIVLDKNRAIISSEVDGAGGTLQGTSDGGESWSNILDDNEYCWEKAISEGTFISLKHDNEEITAITEIGTILRSQDGGKNWKETPK